MNDTKPTSFADSRRLRRWVTGAGVALILLIVGADSYEAWQDYRSTLDAASHTQRALSRAIAEQTARMVQEMDVVLADHAQWRGVGDGVSADRDLAFERLTADVSRFPFLHSMMMIDRDGRSFANTGDATAPPSSRPREGGDPIPGDLRDRKFFTTLEAAPHGAIYIGRPVARQDYLTFAIARAIRDRNGNFAGVVLARIAFEYLTGFYSAINISRDSSIQLSRDDGVVLARYPVLDDTPGDDPIDPLIARMQGTEQVHRDRDTTIEPQLHVLHRVENYPLVVQVAEPVRSVLAEWREDEISSAVRTFTLAALTAALLIALHVVLRRRDRIEAERRRLERGLRDSQKAEAVGFLAASMAHDFNNVLGAIVGYAEVARTHVGDEHRAAGSLDGLLAASERAKQLVGRVLTFDPRRSVVRAALDIEPVVTEAVAWIASRLPASIIVKTTFEPAAPVIAGDATEVHQVVMNLCTNAVRAMPAGGRLEVRVESTPIEHTRELTLGLLRPGQWLRLSIADTGVGLAREQLRSIFDPFYTSQSPGEGHGIGLTVVRNIVTSMGGAIEVESIPSHGTRMSVYWPALGPTTQAAANEPEVERSGRGQAILIVDDELELVRVAEEIVASLGYEAVGFSDPTAAIESFRRTPARFDGVLTDERMPGLRGTTLAMMIHDVRADIPILLVTGCREKEIDARAQEAGVVEILDKPLRAGRLRDALARAL